MFERRPIFGVLIALTICISIWRIAMEEPAILANEMNVYTTKQFQPLSQHQIYTSSLESTTTDNIHFNDEHHSHQEESKNENSLIGSLPKFVTGISDSSSNTINLRRSILNSLNSSKLKSRNLINNQKKLITSSLSPDYDELQKDDIKKLINLNNFEYIINQLPCPKQSKLTNEYYKMGRKRKLSEQLQQQNIPPLILILVHSAPQNFEKRLLIRETWGSLNSSKLRLLFLIGAVKIQLQQNQIELENNMYSDIVQGNFIDNYRNMTYKHVMALKWFKYYCPNAKYLLKVDDDVFINTPQLIEFFKDDEKDENIYNHNNNTNHRKYNNNNNTNILPNHNLLFCQKQNRSLVKRTYRSKWRVSKKEYSERYYPPYCPGYAIIYSSDVVFKLYKLAQNQTYFWIDDVHITGTIAKLANITITSFRPFLLSKNSYENLLFNKNNNNNKDNLIKFTDSTTVPIYNNININNNLHGNNNDGDNRNNSYINYIFLFAWPQINENEIKLLWKFVEINGIKGIR